MFIFEFFWQLFNQLKSAPEPSKTETTTTITMTAPVATKQKYQHGNGTIGTCKEFLNINNLDTCCAQREDECYMNHHDTRCYCDVFCSLGTNHYDCCHDGAFECKIEPSSSLSLLNYDFSYSILNKKTISTIFQKLLHGPIQRQYP